MVQNNHITQLLNNGFVQMESEQDTIDIIQRLRKNQCDMSRVDFNLKQFSVTYEL
jgi:hypothetical protein